MPLLGKPRYNYTIILDADGESEIWKTRAPDSEQAAWDALELSKSRNSRLVNVFREDEW